MTGERDTPLRNRALLAEPPADEARISRLEPCERFVRCDRFAGRRCPSGRRASRDETCRCAGRRETQQSSARERDIERSHCSDYYIDAARTPGERKQRDDDVTF